MFQSLFMKIHEPKVAVLWSAVPLCLHHTQISGIESQVTSWWSIQSSHLWSRRYKMGTKMSWATLHGHQSCQDYKNVCPPRWPPPQTPLFSGKRPIYQQKEFWWDHWKIRRKRRLQGELLTHWWERELDEPSKGKDTGEQKQRLRWFPS